MSSCRPVATLSAFMALLVLFPPTALAQGFPIKSSLAAAGVTGCSAFSVDVPPPVASTSPSTDAEAQQLISDAETAALQGEHVAARDAFTRAAALQPGNARLAYYLGREHEALDENTNAVRQYCRYLQLAPDASDADEVRGRVVRLTPATELARLEEARSNFQTGVALLRRRQYEAADSVFGFVAGRLPAAPEPYFNRALARAARGERATAMQDFEKYLELSPEALDRVRLRDAMSQLPDRVYSPGRAFGSGLLVPGLGQMSTGRPLLGIVSLGAVGGAVALALRSQDETTEQRFTDPFGQPYTDSITTTSRPQLTVGLAAAGAVWLGAALESIFYARRSRQRAESIIAGDPAPRVSLELSPLRGGRLAIGVRLR
jgi:tetratricopeptide (TPR) repeat protein